MPQAGRGVTGQDRPGRLRGGQRSGRTENRLMSAREVLVRTVLAGLWLAGAGCGRSPGASSEPVKAVEARDAFYDGVRLGDGTIVVVGKHGKILRSQDGGNTWALVPSGVDGPLFSIAFRDDDHGVVVGGGGLYLESADRGLSWVPRSIGVDRHLFVIRFIPGGTGFMLGEFGTLLRTDDGGRDWTKVELDWEKLLPELTAALGLVEPHLYDITFCDANHAWMVGEYGLILASEDRGRSWQKQKGGELFDRHLFAVTCVGEGKLVAAGQSGEILYTSDHGTHWVSGVSPRPHDIYDLVSVSPRGHVVALGDLGTVLVSADAGSPKSWSALAATSADLGTLLGHSWLAKGVLTPPGIVAVGESRLSRLELKSMKVNRSDRTLEVAETGP